MSNTKKLLQDIIGIGGYAVLKKAIFKQGSQSVLDPVEFMLPLLIAPRAILSWLVQNIKPMAIGSHKTFDFPGKSDIKIWVQKQDHDVYRGEFVQNGKVIQTFSKQSLPTVAMTMVTTGELYDDIGQITKPEKEKDVTDQLVMDRDDAVKEHEKLVDILRTGSKKELDDEADEQAGELEDYKAGTEDRPDGSFGVARAILDMNDINIHIHNNGPAQSMLASGGLDQVVASLGNLIDRLVGNRIETNRTMSAISDPRISTDDYEGDPVELLDADMEQDMDKEPKGTEEKKAEMPSGAAVAKIPTAPKPPVSPSTKQVSMSAQGKTLKPANPNMQLSGTTLNVQSKQMKKDDMGFTGPSGYFRKRLNKVMNKSETVVTIPAEKLYHKCIHCGTSEFHKSENGQVIFKPCACFSAVEKTERFGKDFVTVSKNENGTYNLSFAADADKDSMMAFLLTLKTTLLSYKLLNKRSK
jgi:hypothetical protein